MGGNKRSESTSRKDTSSDPRGDLYKIINELKSKFDDESKKSEERYNSLCDKFDKVVAENCVLHEKVRILEEKLQEHVGDIDYLSGQVNRLLQEKLNNHILIKGVPEVGSDAALPTIVRFLFEELGVNSRPFEIGQIYRIGKIMEGKRRPIVVCMTTNQSKWNVIRAKRKKSLNASMINLGDKPIGGPDETIYIDEHLTKSNMNLFIEAKKLKNMGCKYVWTMNGFVMVRKSEQEKSFRVENFKTLAETFVKLSKPASSSTGKRQHISPTSIDFTRLEKLIETHNEEKRSKTDATGTDLTLLKTP